MRILMLAQCYPPTLGGQEQHVRNLSIALVRRGHSVAVATLWSQGFPEREVDQGVRVYRIHSSMERAPWLFSSARRFAPPFPDPASVAALRHVIACERPKIVHAHNWLVHSFVPLKAWSGARLIVTLHDYSLVCVQMRRMYRGATLCDGPSLNKCINCAAHHYGRAKGISTLLANRAMGIAERRAVDMFLPVSWAVATGNNLMSHHLPFQVMPNFVPDGVGEPVCPPIRRPPELPDGDYLLYVGDLTRDKGIEVLLRAYVDLPGAPPLVLIGRPCSDIPVEFPQNVTVLQNWAHDDVMEAWRHSTLGLVPSLCPDACPTVVMEAMATGRPVIGSQIGGLSDLIADGETGMLVPPGDAAALRNAIARLLRDPILRDRMGRAAQRRVTQFQASAIVPRIEQVYKQQCDTDVVAGKAALVAQHS